MDQHPCKPTNWYIRESSVNIRRWPPPHLRKYTTRLRHTRRHTNPVLHGSQSGRRDQVYCRTGTRLFYLTLSRHHIVKARSGRLRDTFRIHNHSLEVYTRQIPPNTRRHNQTQCSLTRLDSSIQSHSHHGHTHRPHTHKYYRYRTAHCTRHYANTGSTVLSRALLVRCMCCSCICHALDTEYHAYQLR